MRLRVGTLAVAAVALGGCAIGPDYERPADVVPVEAFRDEITPQQADSFADLGWAEVFADPELQGLIRRALDNNLDLAIAAERVAEFRGQARAARGALGPQVRATGSTSPSGASDEDAAYSLGLVLSWEIDLFGRLRRADEAARAALLASEDNARGVMAALVADVASTWFELRNLDAEVEIVRRTIGLRTDSLALVESLARNGVASGTEVQQAVNQLASTRAQLPLAEQQRTITENRLRFLLGYAPDAVPRAPSPASFEVPKSVPAGLPAQLLTRRPDIRRLENELRAATANVGVALANRFPYLSIGLTSFFGLLSPELDRLLDGDDPAQELFAVGPFVDAPIFQSGAGVGGVEAARARARQAELAYRRGVLQALREVADALAATERSLEFIVHNEERVVASSEVLRLQMMRYRAGVVSYLEVLDAERQLFDAEIDLARARRDHVLAYVLLYRALGGGWSETEIERLLASRAE